MHLHATFQHMKGHQDNKKPFSSLDLLAQLNVEADQFAGDFLCQNGDNLPLIPLMPTRPISLEIGGLSSIPLQYKKTIREAASGPPLLAEMQAMYSWPTSVLNSVDWEAHRAGLQSQPTRRIHYVKLCHKVLPVGKQVKLYGQCLPDFCPLCSTPNKTHHHVLRCPHSTRKKWRSTLLEKLGDKCRQL